MARSISNRVLPTLNADGTRYRLRPRLYTGRWYRARRRVAWGLVALFVSLPLLRVDGSPAVLLDVVHRRFILFGRTFLATDGVLLMLLMLTIFIGIIGITALVGRAWCGWGCPQTVYMEFLFRPIERWFEGDREDQLRIDKRGWSGRRALKNLVFLLLSFALGNLFLSYFVGTDTLLRWMQQSPFEHLTPFLVVAATTGLVFFDFAYFREQMCTVICPYARLQSVLLDKKSLIIGYDTQRGEPRSKGKPKPGHGDCIDCNACVVTCPTGIDIRNGLQLECIACAQCVDACNTIMPKIQRPPNLIRYGSQLGFELGKAHALLRPRILVYVALFTLLLSALFFTASHQGTADVTLLRSVGAPFLREGGTITNQIRIKIENRTNKLQRYQFELLNAPQIRLISEENPISVEPGTHRTGNVFVLVPEQSFDQSGTQSVHFRISDGAQFQQDYPYKLLGPARTGAKQ